MKSLFLTFFLAFNFSILSFSQVGINTTNPNAALDIQASNQITPSSTDGILIPKVDAFPLTAPGALQHGMLVYLTTTDVPSGSTLGFYYWDNPSTTWISFGGYHKIDDLTDGKSDVDGSSIFLGINAGAGDDASDNENIGVGFESLSSNTTGFENIAVGNAALKNSIDGEHSIAVGFEALLTDTKSVRNTAVGFQALRLNQSNIATEAINNTAIGWKSLTNNTTGYENTGVGTESLLDNTTGYNNTAVGRETMKKNTTGPNNTALGYQALRTSTSVDGRNVAIGGQTLSFYSAVGGFNTAVGFQAGYKSTGEKNVLLGYFAGTADGGGDSNVMVGYEAGFSSTGDGNVMLGNQAGRQETGSNTLYIDNTNTAAPLIYGEFDTDIIDINGDLEVKGDIITETIKVGTNGTAITEIIKATVNFDVPSVAANNGQYVIISVSNAQVGSTVFVSPQNNLARGLVISYARVNNAGTIHILFTNASGTAIDPAAMDYYITVMN